jgi:roadblock/LC7 domain-containing protein
LFEKPTSGGGEERLLLHTAFPKIPTSVSPDGRLLIYQVQVPKTGIDIWALPMRGPDSKPFPVVQTVYDEMGGQLSPDGEWLAYQSNASGSMEVYVRQFPGAAVERQISTAGGAQPRWAPSGKELFYVAPNGRLMAAIVRPGPDASSLESGAPHPLFQIRLAKGVNVDPAVGTKPQYAVSPDGRFLVNMPVEGAAPPPIIVTANWTTVLKH